MDDTDAWIAGRNCYLWEGKAYTVDDVLIYNLSIYEVPIYITKDQIEVFFGKFGEILKIRLNTYRKGTSKPMKSGFVHFKEAESAVKVLELEECKINQISFGVKASDTWHQPLPIELVPPETASPRGVYRKPKPPENVVADPGRAATPSIGGFKCTDLNNDCLEHILKFVDMGDLVKFARVSLRFRGIVEMLCKSQYRVLKLMNLPDMPLWDVRDFLALAGPHIEALEVDFSNYGLYYDRIIEQLIESIIKYVADLKRLALRGCRMKMFVLRKIRRKFRGLKELDLEFCQLDDHALAIISRLPNLETLSLADNFDLVGTHLKSFGKLKALNIFRCWKIQPRHFAAMCAAQTELRSLNISYCDQLDDTCLRQIVLHCKKLETVKIDSFFEVPIDSLATLPYLKCLEIVGIDILSQHLELLCLGLAEHRSNQLEELLIKMADFAQISKEAVQAIGKLKRLRLLDLSHFDIDGKGISYFHKLENLVQVGFESCKNLNDEDVLRLVSSCKNLRFVNITNCGNVSVESVTEILHRQERKVAVEQIYHHRYFKIIIF